MKMKKYDKRNDPIWCMGVFMLPAGIVLLAFLRHTTWGMIREHPSGVFAFTVFLVGLVHVVFWLHKSSIIRNVEGMTDDLNQLSSHLDSMKEPMQDLLAELDRKAEQSTGNDSE